MVYWESQASGNRSRGHGQGEVQNRESERYEAVNWQTGAGMAGQVRTGIDGAGMLGSAGRGQPYLFGTECEGEQDFKGRNRWNRSLKLNLIGVLRPGGVTQSMARQRA